MSDFIHVEVSVGSIDEARKIGRELVQQRLVASAEIIPWVESISLLDNRLDTEQQSKLILLSTREKFEQIAAFVQKNSHYQIPEILCHSIEDFSGPYLQWIEDSLKLSRFN